MQMSTLVSITFLSEQRQKRINLLHNSKHIRLCFFLTVSPLVYTQHGVMHTILKTWSPCINNTTPNCRSLSTNPLVSLKYHSSFRTLCSPRNYKMQHPDYRLVSLTLYLCKLSWKKTSIMCRSRKDDTWINGGCIWRHSFRGITRDLLICFLIKTMFLCRVSHCTFIGEITCFSVYYIKQVTFVLHIQLLLISLC